MFMSIQPEEVAKLALAQHQLLLDAEKEKEKEKEKLESPAMLKKVIGGRVHFF